MTSSTRETGILTVAAIRRPTGEGAVEYLFNERQRIFTLQPNVKSFDQTSKLLEASFKNKIPLQAVLDTRRPLIRKADELSPEELRDFKQSRTLLDKPDKPRRLDLSSIDPTTFNHVGPYLKHPSFRLCTRIVPSYARAKTIFDFCALQSCHLPGPTTVTPCIPFQYVRDGCYARAHKMRWIITTRYRYCCEKVFSFANVGPNRLAVQANKWGGCCVTWWYHVAPLIRVRAGRLGVVAMVIDPSMFNKPVLLSTWLEAQEVEECDPNAEVSMFSIQPGSAYTPANHAGTAFATDPAYTATDATLIGYKSLTTCP